MTESVPSGLLEHGHLELSGRLVHASNGTFYCRLQHDGREASAIYKPVRGERPLWDFPEGTLASRELATYLVSEASGWSLVPRTILRDGPLGPGMVQLWVEEEAVPAPPVDVVPRGRVERGWRAVLDAYDQDGDEVSLVHGDSPPLRRIALLDVLVNNADRKGGHVLPVGSPHQVQAIDHGLCFHTEDKLRTVLWGWAGEALNADELADLDRLRDRLSGELGSRLDELLRPEELAAFESRIDKIRGSAVFPHPPDEWLALPWPVF